MALFLCVLALQTAAWAFDSSHPKSLAMVREGGRGLTILFWRRRSPAARGKGRASITMLVRTWGRSGSGRGGR
jgi:hypothetical protein